MTKQKRIESFTLDAKELIERRAGSWVDGVVDEAWSRLLENIEVRENILALENDEDGQLELELDKVEENGVKSNLNLICQRRLRKRRNSKH